MYARMHLPVAPECNIRCNYCNRKFDCVNESRPGVTSEILTPKQAYEKYLLVSKKLENLSVIGFAGPGDALANFVQVRETVELIKNDNDNITFCLSTNGLMLPHYAEDIINLGISHVTVTINSVDPKISAAVYSHINYENKFYTGEKGAVILLENQLKGLKILADAGTVIKVNIVAIRGINDFHIEEVVKTAKNYGAYKTNIMQLVPAENTKFQNILPLGTKELNNIRNKCSSHLKQMYHCKQCRADAIGTLTNDISPDFVKNCFNCV